MSEQSRSDALLEAVEQAIVDLSVHPAGCVDWLWYMCRGLEVADRLDDAVVEFKAQNEGAKG